MNKKNRTEKRGRLLGLFSSQLIDHYEEKKVGNAWFVKNYNAGSGFWQVSEYSLGSFAKYKSFQNRTDDINEMEYKINKDD